VKCNSLKVTAAIALILGASHSAFAIDPNNFVIHSDYVETHKGASGNKTSGSTSSVYTATPYQTTKYQQQTANPKQVVLSAEQLRDIEALKKKSQVRMFPEISTDLPPVDQYREEEAIIWELKKERMQQLVEEERYAEELKLKLKREKRDRDIQNAYIDAVPLRPEEIKLLRSLTRDVQKASQTPLNGGPEQVIKTIDLDIDSPRPVDLKVAKGYVSSMVFFDSYGNPWPIDSIAIGDSGAFNAEVVSKDNNVLAMGVKRPFAQGNVLINLADLAVPLVASLVGDDYEIHSRLNIRIPKSGPNTEFEAYVEKEMEAIPSEMMGFLNGEIPSGAVQRKLIRANGEAWAYQGHYYIRTTNRLVSPAWINSVESPTGFIVYKLPMVSVLRIVEDGVIKNASIGDFVNVKDGFGATLN
jgi:intracellular multiplication protein IcmK